MLPATRINDNFLAKKEGNLISEVTVFSHQAQIKRQFRIHPVPGINRYNIELTAFSIDPESSQARVFGKGEILGVQYLEIPVKDIPQQKIRDLDEEKRTLGREKKSLILTMSC
ncbi:MAG: DUF4140 domain-containing protein [Bacteroidetes bacterium]|nr:DUF4140 domain-containing protein [Bacteroidota bacterium]